MSIFLLVLFGDFFLFIPLFACLCMMWCVEDGSYVEYAEVEDFQDVEQQQALVEGKSLLHSRLSYTTCNFNYTFYLFITLH
jgi:hypothetical protein